MKSKPDIAGLIQSFNLNQTERTAMFQLAVPDPITMVLHALRDPHDRTSAAHPNYKAISEKVFLLLEHCAGEARRFGIESNFEFEEEAGVDHTQVWVHPTPEQSEWFTKGMYLQLTFYNQRLIHVANPWQALATAMTLYDHSYSRQMDIDPTNHEDMRVRAIHARDARLMVGDVYRENVGVWCRQLVDFRTMILVKCRAVLLGEDSDGEYNRFVKAGGKYFLDYPVLCP